MSSKCFTYSIQLKRKNSDLCWHHFLVQTEGEDEEFTLTLKHCDGVTCSYDAHSSGTALCNMWCDFDKDETFLLLLWLWDIDVTCFTLSTLKDLQSVWFKHLQALTSEEGTRRKLSDHQCDHYCLNFIKQNWKNMCVFIKASKCVPHRPQSHVWTILNVCEFVVWNFLLATFSHIYKNSPPVLTVNNQRESAELLLTDFIWHDIKEMEKKKSKLSHEPQKHIET